MLRLVSPEKKIFEREVKSVRCPGAGGFFGVLPRHAAMISLTESGLLEAETVDGERIGWIVHDGFAEVSKDSLVILTNSAENPENVDLERAQAAAKRARERMQDRVSDLDLVRARASLRRSLIREKYGRHS